MIIFSGVFSYFFWQFWFSGSIVVVKGQKMVQNDNKLCAPYLSNHTSYDCHLWYKCVKWYYLQVFFSMLKFWFSSLSRGWKGKKMAQNLENFCLLHLIFQELYMIFIYGTHVCIKGSYLQAFFHFFKNFDKRAENGSKWQKLFSVSLSMSGTIHHMIVIFDAHE